MQPRLDRLTDQDVDELAGHYDAFAGEQELPDSWRWWYAELADLLRVEQARRMMAAAADRDPLAYCWYGRLTSDNFGRWPRGEE